MVDVMNTKIQHMVNNQIDYIRRMSILPDETLRALLTQQIIEHPHLVDNYENEEKRKLLHDITKAAKDVKASPLKIARKVDGGIKLQ